MGSDVGAGSIVSLITKWCSATVVQGGECVTTRDEIAGYFLLKVKRQRLSGWSKEVGLE